MCYVHVYRSDLQMLSGPFAHIVSWNHAACCLSVSLSVCLSVSLSVSAACCLSVCLSVSLSVCSSVLLMYTVCISPTVHSISTYWFEEMWLPTSYCPWNSLHANHCLSNPCLGEAAGWWSEPCAVEPFRSALPPPACSSNYPLSASFVTVTVVAVSVLFLLFWVACTYVLPTGAHRGAARMMPVPPKELQDEAAPNEELAEQMFQRTLDRDGPWTKNSRAEDLKISTPDGNTGKIVFLRLQQPLTDRHNNKHNRTVPT